MIMANYKTITRTILKKELGRGVRFIPQVRRALKRGLTVFLFHEVSDQPSEFAEEYGLAVSTNTFQRQVSWIQSNFDIIHPADVFNETSIPQRAALISFDDGFRGVFENGLAILEKMGVPSIIFLNMQAILEQKPILSAIASFLNRYVPEFSDFSKSVGILPPFHLSLSPSILNSFEKYYGPVDKDAMLDYQGQFADLSMLKTWNNKDIVVYGNHLFDHWNAPALCTEEFEDQYKKNEVALSQLMNYVNLFSFTNGRFSGREVDLLKQMGAGKVFSTAGGVNRDVSKYVLGRMSLYESDKDQNHLWFQIGRAALNNLLHSQSR